MYVEYLLKVLIYFCHHIFAAFFYIFWYSLLCLSDAVSGSASQSSSANDISSMSTEHTLASDTDSSSIDTLTGPLDESQWAPPFATRGGLLASRSPLTRLQNICQLSPPVLIFSPQICSFSWIILNLNVEKQEKNLYCVIGWLFAIQRSNLSTLSFVSVLVFSLCFLGEC